MEKEPKPVDSGKYKVTLYGILNKDGDFWTPVPFTSEQRAWEHVREFWGKQTDMAVRCLRDFKIVPVRARVSALPTPKA